MNNKLNSVYGKLKSAITKSGAARAKLTAHAKDLADDGEPYVPVGVNGVLASTEKLLAVNRGLIPTDERDSVQFKKTFRTSDLLKERVRLDADKLRRALVRKAAKSKNLNALHPFYFDPYAERHLVGNPLSSPLEEINPMQLVEQARRVTLMGPGGLGTSQAITEESQSLHPSSFGFLSSIEGPECLDNQSDVYTKRGWVAWPDITDDDEFACHVDGNPDGNVTWCKANRIVREQYIGPMILASSSCIRMCVTPSHRVLYGGEGWIFKPASVVYGKHLVIPATIPTTSSGIEVLLVGEDKWTTMQYNGLVYCATVPGGLLYVRGSKETQGFWSGNSEKIGVDSRLAWGSKMGSNGRIYQKFFDNRIGKYRYMSAEDLDGLVLRFPD